MDNDYSPAVAEPDDAVAHVLPDPSVRGEPVVPDSVAELAQA